MASGEARRQARDDADISWADPSAYPPRSYAYFVIGVLTLATFVALLDRNLPALLLPQIRHAFSLSDTSVSFLQGYAFALFYAVAGIPLGRLIDRAHRRNIILAGILFWSSATIASGFSTQYWHLLLARAGVAIGEACLLPAAYSLISDYVPPQIRGRAMAFYFTAQGLGAGASLLIGGLFLALMAHVDMVRVPLLGELAPWRVLFLLAGIPGFFVALLLLAVRETPRHEDTLPAAIGDRKGSVGEFIGYVRSNRAAFLYPLSSYTLLALVLHSVGSWGPTFYLRTFGLPMSQGGMIIGPLTAVFGFAGALSSGFLSDHWLAKGYPDARFRVILVAWSILLPAVILWALVDNIVVSFALYAAIILSSVMAVSGAALTLHAIVPNRMRGQAVALYLLAAGLVGIGLGATLVALSNDFLFHDDNALRYSFIVVCVPVGLLGVSCALLGLKPYGRVQSSLRDAERVAAMSAGRGVA